MINAVMNVHFWGSRGSVPASFSTERLRPKLREVIELSLEENLKTEEDIDKFIDSLPFELNKTAGTNTSCVEIRGGDEFVLCDCGSGLRDFSSYVWELHHSKPQTFNIFMSHLHWDHIMGFPFFVPAYVPGNKINIYSAHEDCEMAFHRQQKEPSFPVPMEFMASDIQFHKLDVDKEYEVAGLKVNVMKQNHPGGSYGYAFHKDGKKVVYSTDSEHTVESNKEDYPFIDFFKDADILIFDAQYELFDAIDTKANWGHSSNVIGIELAVRSNVKRLCLFHNEHTADDEVLSQFLQETKNYLHIYKEEYPLEVHLSHDGLSIDCDDPIVIETDIH